MTGDPRCLCRQKVDEPIAPEPNLAKQLAASILVLRVERDIMPLLAEIRDDANTSDAIRWRAGHYYNGLVADGWKSVV